MTPEYQFAASWKYIARPVILVPTPSGQFVVMESYGARRDYIGTFSSAELARWAENDFARQQSQREAQLAKETARVSVLLPNLDLDFTL